MNSEDLNSSGVFSDETYMKIENYNVLQNMHQDHPKEDIKSNSDLESYYKKCVVCGEGIKIPSKRYLRYNSLHCSLHCLIKLNEPEKDN